MSARSQNFAFDLQSNLSFHKLMGNRFKQFFGWADLLNYSKKSPFPLTITKPEFGGLTIGKTGTLQTSFVLNGVVQSYRSEQWWNWIVIGGVANAEVELTVAQGKISYKTTITPKNAKLNYGAEYRAKFKKSGSPPAKRILAAVTGFQPKLSGSFMFPVIELAKAGSYQLSSIKWIDSNSFVLSWTELN